MPLILVYKAEDVLGKILQLSILLLSSYFSKVISIIGMYSLSQGKTIQPVTDPGTDHCAADPLHAAMCASSCEQEAMSNSS